MYYFYFQKHEQPEETLAITIIAFILQDITIQVAIEDNDDLYTIDKDILTNFLAVTEEELETTLQDPVPL